jgi:hypothetical protein
MTSLRLPLLFALAQWLLRWRILLQLVPVAARSSFPEIETQMVWIYVYESASILPQDFEIVSFFLGASIMARTPGWSGIFIRWG